MKKKIVFFTALVWILLTSCSAPLQKYQAEFFDVFDTYITLTGYAHSEKEFQKYENLIYGEMLRLHKLFDIYNDYEGVPNLKTINDNAGIQPVEVDASVIDLLKRAQAAYVKTGGIVNVALGPVLRIWHEARTAALDDPATARVPSMEELRQAALHTAIQNIVIDEEHSTVFLREAEMSLDVGSIAKGYAAQCAVDLAKKEGFSSGVLNAGGNVCVVGKPQDGRENWSVGVQSPTLSQDGVQELYDTVYVQDCAVVSSGDYQRFYRVDGVTYHHIIDPETLFPAARVHAVSVIHPDSTTADVLSTAAFILPFDRAKALIEEQGAQAIWILADGTSVATDGYAAISKDHGA